jgi:hypothetical protein
MSQLNKSQELKPCPFCGSSVEVKDFCVVHAPLSKSNFNRNAFISCSDEECPIGFHMAFTSRQSDWEEIITSKWNERALATAPTATKAVKVPVSNSHLQTRLF